MIDFEQLYHDAYHKIRDYIFYRFWTVISFEDAEDIVQEAFAKAMEKQHTFRGDSKPSTWLSSLAVNYTIDEYVRKPQRQRDRLYFAARQDRIDWQPASEARIIYDTTIELLLPRHQELIRGIDELDYDCHELAAQIGTTANGVKASLHRARRNFREHAR